MSKLDLIRHLELFNPDTFKTPITVLGAGATGSWLALALAKLGIEDITVWDYDTVESHNIPNQSYGIDDIEQYKVIALQSDIETATGINIKIKPEKFTNQKLNGFVFLMVDSMTERKEYGNQELK